MKNARNAVSIIIKQVEASGAFYDKQTEVKWKCIKPVYLYPIKNSLLKGNKT